MINRYFNIDFILDSSEFYDFILDSSEFYDFVLTNDTVNYDNIIDDLPLCLNCNESEYQYLTTDNNLILETNDGSFLQYD